MSSSDGSTLKILSASIRSSQHYSLGSRLAKMVMKASRTKSSWSKLGPPSRPFTH